MSKLLLNYVNDLILPLGLTEDDKLASINLSKTHYDIDMILSSSIDNLFIEYQPVKSLYIVRESDVSYNEDRLRTWYTKNIMLGKACTLVRYFSDCIKFLPQSTYSIEKGKLFHAIEPNGYHIMRVGSGFVLIPPSISLILSNFTDKERTEFLDVYVPHSQRTNPANAYSCLDYRFENYIFFSANFY